MKKQLLTVTYILIFVCFFAAFSALSANEQNTKTDTIEPSAPDSLRVEWLLQQTKLNVFDLPIKAIQFANEAVALSEKLHYEKGLASGKAYLADLYMNYNSGLAEKYQFEALEHANNSNDRALILRVTNQTGIFYQTIGQYGKAEPYFRKLLSELMVSGKDSIAAAVINNLAVGFRYRGYSDSSFAYLKKAEAINIRFGSKLWLSQNYLNIGQYYLTREDYTNALIYLEKSLQLTQEINYKRNLPLVHVRLAKTWLKKGEYHQALTHGKISLMLSQQFINRFREKEALELMKQVFVEEGHIDSAFRCAEQLASLNDSIHQDETEQDEKARQQRFELSEQLRQQEVSVLEMNAQKSKKNFIILLLVFVSSITLLVLAVLFFRQRNKILQHELDYQISRQENASLQQDIDIRNRELATHLMVMQKKNESVLRISEELKKLQLEGQGELSINNIVKNLTRTSEEKIWPEFEKRFKEINKDFYKNLSTRHPDLTPNELKLCAFMKMNLSTKDINSITSQTPETIKMARYRLRSKLGLSRSENLVSYLNQI